MKRITAWIVTHPLVSIVVVLLVSAAFAYQLPKLRINVSPHLLMVGTDPAVQFYEQTKERFGNDELTMIVVKADDVFTPKVLDSIDHLSEGVTDIPEVVRVDSLTTVNNIRGEEGSVAVGPLLAGVDVTDPTALRAVRRDALRNPVLAGKLVSADGRTTAVLIYSDSDSDDLQFSERFTDQIDAVVQAEAARSGLEMYQVGRPYRQAVQGRTLVADQELIWPIGGLTIMVVLALMFRSVSVVVITAIARLISIVWAVGLMAAFGYPVSMLSAMVPLLLISVGFTEDIHIISEYRYEIARGHGKREAIAVAMQSLATPLLATSFTTAVGFAGLSLSPIMILHQLGVIASLGFACSFFVTFLVVPALLRYFPAPKLLPVTDGQAAPPSRLVAGLLRLCGGAIRHRRALFVGSAAVSLLLASGIPRMLVDNDILGFFRPGSEIRRRVQDIHESLAGAQVFYVVVDSEKESGILQPKALGAVAGLQRFLADTGEIDETLSVTDFLETVNREMNGGDDRFLALPDSADLAAQYLVLLHPSDTERYIDFDYAAANILVRHNIASTRRMHALLSQIDEYAAGHMPGLRVTPTSETILTTRAADELASSMVTGMGFTIVIVGLTCAVFFMSIRAALLSLIPNLVPIAIVFGLVGWLGIPINVGTSMVAAIAIGIAVDDTIHYMARNSAELNLHHDLYTAMVETISAEGRVTVATSLALAAGFLVFAVSAFVPLAYFGVLAAVTMIVALLADLTITPALMASTRLITLWNVVGMKLGGDICKLSPLFRDLTPLEARKIVLLGRLQQIEAGRAVVQRGQSGSRTMYVVVTGGLRVCLRDNDREQVLARLAPGQLFGEMALIDARERSADVVADVPSEVLALDRDDIARIERRFPRTALKLLHNLSIILSERLRAATPLTARRVAAANEAVG